jgi:hypothetical protein
MRSTTVCHAWVVYRMTLPKNVIGGNVVCEQREWDIIEAARPGYHTLLHSGIRTEQEAEKLARGAASQLVPQPLKKTAEIVPLYTTDLAAQPPTPIRSGRPRSGSRAA